MTDKLYYTVKGLKGKGWGGEGRGGTFKKPNGWHNDDVKGMFLRSVVWERVYKLGGFVLE